MYSLLRRNRLNQILLESNTNTVDISPNFSVFKTFLEGLQFLFSNGSGGGEGGEVE